MTSLAVAAQQTPLKVEPGTKGSLPEVQAPAPLEAGHFAGLELSYTGYDSWVVNGHYNLIATISFPLIETYGGEYYTAQYRAHGTDKWETISDDGTPVKYKDRTVGIPSPFYYATVDFRIIIHGGPMDGYVSNVVTAEMPSMLSRYTGWNEAEAFNTVVGKEVGNTFDITTTTHMADGKDVEYTSKDGYYTYQWYRRNPNNFDLTPIDGATSLTYTPTTADVGYQLLVEVRGDNKHCSFALRHAFGSVVVIPVQASFSYVGNDGFILDTDYDIPAFEKEISLTGWNDEGEYTKKFPEGIVTERKPGQYAIHCNPEEYNYATMIFDNSAYLLTFVYDWGYWEGETYVPNLQYREAQLMAERYKGPISVTAKMAGSTVPATVELLRPNIDGIMEVVESQTIEPGVADTIEFMAYVDDYYFKARKTDGTLDTYFPSTTLWQEAKTERPSEFWEPKTVAIDVLPAPAPLTGTGIIEGTVNGVGVQMVKPFYVTRADDGSTCTVYLKEKEGAIVAETTTDDSGNYRFENVPFGAYQVLINVDGCTMESAHEVTLTAEAPTASNVDYTLNDGSFTPSGVEAVRMLSERENVYDLSGRIVRSKQSATDKLPRGIYIQGKKKMLMK